MNNILGFENSFIGKKLKGDLWEVYLPLKYNYSLHESVIVPHGFVTDLASVPRGVWNIIPKDGTHTPAAVLHDWLYYKALFPRKTCDKLFYEAMRSLGVASWKRGVMYRAVRTFGWIGYNKRKQKIEDKQNKINMEV